jgi:hypothetical protein
VHAKRLMLSTLCAMQTNNLLFLVHVQTRSSTSHQNVVFGVRRYPPPAHPKADPLAGMAPRPAHFSMYGWRIRSRAAALRKCSRAADSSSPEAADAGPATRIYTAPRAHAVTEGPAGPEHVYAPFITGKGPFHDEPGIGPPRRELCCCRAADASGASVMLDVHGTGSRPPQKKAPPPPGRRPSGSRGREVPLPASVRVGRASHRLERGAARHPFPRRTPVSARRGGGGGGEPAPRVARGSRGRRRSGLAAAPDAGGLRLGEPVLCPDREVVRRAVVGPAAGSVVPGGRLVRAFTACLLPGRVGEGLELLASLEAFEVHQGLFKARRNQCQVSGTVGRRGAARGGRQSGRRQAGSGESSGRGT